MLSRSWARVLLLGYTCFLAAVLLWPTPEIPSGSVTVVDEVLGALGIGDGDTTRAAIEFVLNVVVFAALPVLAAVAGFRPGVLAWTMAGLVGSGSVELFQALAAGGRSGSLRDLAANTLGAVLGAAGVSWFDRRRAESSRADGSPP